MTLRLFDKLETRFLEEMKFLESQFLSNRYSGIASYNHRTTDSKHYYELDLPGMTKEDIQIKVDTNSRTLNIWGHRKNKYEEDGKYKVKQVSYGEFYRNFSLDRDVDLNSVKAAFKDGVLVIAFNKEVNSKTNMLDVKLED